MSAPDPARRWRPPHWLIVALVVLGVAVAVFMGVVGGGPTGDDGAPRDMQTAGSAELAELVEAVGLYERAA